MEAPVTEDSNPAPSKKLKLKCDNDCKNSATLECTNCNSFFCQSCFNSCHAAHVMKKHTTKPLTVLNEEDSNSSSNRENVKKSNENSDEEETEDEAKQEEVLEKLRVKINVIEDEVNQNIRALNKDVIQSKDDLNQAWNNIINEANDKRQAQLCQIDQIHAGVLKDLEQRKEAVKFIVEVVNKTHMVSRETMAQFDSDINKCLQIINQIQIALFKTVKINLNYNIVTSTFDKWVSIAEEDRNSLISSSSNPSASSILPLSPSEEFSLKNYRGSRGLCRSDRSRDVTKTRNFSNHAVIAPSREATTRSSVPNASTIPGSPPNSKSEEKMPIITSSTLRSIKDKAQSGDANSQYQLAKIYDQANGVARDLRESRRWYIKSAEQGNVLAQYELACIYHYGRATLRDYREARKWFTKAGDQGHALSQNYMGFLCKCGKGGPQDLPEARRWFEKSAEAGEERAMDNMGMLFYCGIGVQQDFLQARKWFELGAEKGFVESQFQLGVMYKRGIGGLPTNFTEAKKWFQKAALQGHAYAPYQIGSLYYTGKGVRRDEEEAMRWFNKSAEMGDPYGQFWIGCVWEDRRDSKKAIEAFEKAAEQGDKRAKQKLLEYKALNTEIS